MLTENKPQTDPLGDKTLSFAIRIVKLNRHLTETKKEFVLSKQVLRSGTNPGAMVREAKNAESSSDFMNKTEYDSMNFDAIEIIKLLTSSIRTKKANLK